MGKSIKTLGFPHARADETQGALHPDPNYFAVAHHGGPSPTLLLVTAIIAANT
jgi:hypothetical protein